MDNSTLADMDICRKSLDILDSSISFMESGSGSPVIFLHGNPTSSFLWRNIIPIVRDTAWCLAPDLVGMGRSGRSSGEHHGFHDHFKYLNEWFNQMAFEDQVTQ